MIQSETKLFHTMCPMNCHPTFCGMVAEVRGKKLLKTSGDVNNPDSKGFLCIRGRAAEEIIGNEKRLLHPLVRKKRGLDDWQTTGWDDVLDLIASRMKEVNPEMIGFLFGHGNGSNDYHVGVKGQLIERFANLYGTQWWNPAMLCWGLGGFGIGLTGILETSTKEDMGANSELVVLWGASFASQPNTIPYILAAKRRGAKIITIDVRNTEATAQSHAVYLLKPATDTALALAMMNVIISENLHDITFIEANTVGFDELATHVKQFTPDWAAKITGLEISDILSLARTYAKNKPSMLIIGGSSIHKGSNGWQAARAISCLPGLTGNLGKRGSGIGPRHGATAHGRGMGSIAASNRRKKGNWIPNQMKDIVTALKDGNIQVLLLPGSNIISSFADTKELCAGLERVGLIVSTDLFMNETARQFADVILPSTCWLEEIGCKATNTHLYLMDKAIAPPGEARPMYEVLTALASRLGLEDYYPWKNHEEAINEVLAHACTSYATVASLRANRGQVALKISHVAYPTQEYDTPSGKVEFYSAIAEESGLPPLPTNTDTPETTYPLTLCQGRTLTHFHSFYDQGQALPTLAKHNEGPVLWMSSSDAESRNLQNGDGIRIFNNLGNFTAKAQISESILTGTVWMRDGWFGLNNVTSGESVVPEEALHLFPFSVGQSNYGAQVDVVAYTKER